jgi:hypothetical protein
MKIMVLEKFVRIKTRFKKNFLFEQQEKLFRHQKNADGKKMNFL